MSETIQTAPCPNCERITSIVELNQWRGVCVCCRKSFLTAHSNWLHKDFKPADETAPEPILETAHDPHVDEHEVVPGYVEAHHDFDWAAIDGEDEPTAADVLEKTGEALRRIMVWAFTTRDVLTGTRRLACAAFILRPDLFEVATMQDLAKELNLTKQSVSRHALRFADAHNLRFRNQRSKASRALMAARQRGHANHNTNGKNRTKG